MQALSVGAVVAFLREVLEANEIFSDLWIVGEVSNYNRSQLGHRYFSLKDSAGVLRSVLFRDTMPGMQLKDGDRVLAHGRLTVYAQRGDLQFVCDFVRPEGVGIIAARFEELKLRLEAEGLFEPGRKRPLPRFPLRIGLVTSAAGAALQDVKNVLASRWPLATLVFAAATVQGPEAPGEIAGALRALAHEPGLDFVILARGGGSAEDLSAFNSEAVARAVFGMPVPVVSGVGHETDESIADYVADLRAPTPSAAVERSTPDIREVLRALLGMDRALAGNGRRAIGQAAARVESSARRVERAGPDAGALTRDVSLQADQIFRVLERALAANRGRTDEVAGRLGALNPHATLARGFAIVQDARSRKVVRTVRKVRGGDRLSVAVSDGAFWVEVS